MEDLIPPLPSSAVTFMTLVPGSQSPNRYQTLHGEPSAAQPDDSQQKFLCFPSDPCSALLGWRIVLLFLRTSLKTDTHRPSAAIKRLELELKLLEFGVYPIDPSEG